MIETEIISIYNDIWSCKLQLKSTFISFELLLSNIKRRASLKGLFLELNNNVNKQKLQQIPLREKYVIDNIKI